MISAISALNNVGQRHLNEEETFKLAEKLLFEDVYKYFKDNGCLLVSSSYISTKRKLSYVAQCGHMNDIAYDNFKNKNQGRQCPNCVQSKAQRSARRRQYSIDEVSDVFRKNGCELLETEYISSKTKMRCICICGEIRLLTYEDVSKGSHCRECSFRKTSETLLKYSLDDVKRIFKEADCELLSKSYRSVRDILTYKCNCGNKSKVRFSAFLSGARCKNCAIEKQIGENNYQWKHDKTDEERLKGRKFRDYELWRRRVFERDNYTCHCCDQYGGGLAAHHLDGWHWCIERRLDVSNGVTLFKSCHTDFHDVYTKFNNTEAQYAEWINNTRNQDAV